MTRTAAHELEGAGSDSLYTLVSQLSLERRVELTAGASLWSTAEAPELGLGAISVSDGPNGVRGNSFDERDVASSTPCGTALAASWDPEVVGRVGMLVAEDARRMSVDVVLGPTMNIHRSPLGGRGFECFSEDPLLSGAIAAAWIVGLQSRGVGATAKHFVCNDAETARMTVDCVVGERVLREIYFVPFELAVRAGVWAIMTGYNRVNGRYVNPALVAGVLKAEWGWDGLVMSDWAAHGDTIGWATGGLDLEMPGPGRVYGDSLLEAVREGTVDEATLDDKVVRVLRLARRVGCLRGSAPTTAVSPADQALESDVLVDAAAAGFVLLRNDAGLLPLRSGLKTIAVIGPNADDPAYQGGGSAHVNLRSVPTPLEAIGRRLHGVEVLHERGCSPRPTLPDLHLLETHGTCTPNEPGITVEYFSVGASEPSARELRQTSSFVWWGDTPGIGGESGRARVSTVLTPRVSGTYRFSLRGGPTERRLTVGGQPVTHFIPDEGGVAHFFSRREARGEVALRAGEPVTVEAELELVAGGLNTLDLGCSEPDLSDPLQAAVHAAAAADVVILVVGTSEDVEREDNDRDTTALPGDQEELGRQVLAANPATIVVVNAATAVDLGWASAASAILYAWYPGEAFGFALADVLTGDREPGGRLPITIGKRHEDYPVWETAPDAAGQVHYRESVFVGYRHFDAARIEPEFCFGHGLGYSEFAYERLELSTRSLAMGESLSVGVVVRNAGRRRSKEVVQLYVRDPEATVARPPRELKGFAALELDQDEARLVAFELDERAFAFWDEQRHEWLVEPGSFEVHVGRSSRDIRLVGEVVVAGGE